MTMQPHTSLRKAEGEEWQRGQEKQLADAQALATPESQASLKSSQTPPGGSISQQLEHLDLSSTGTEEGQQH